MDMDSQGRMRGKDDIDNDGVGKLAVDYVGDLWREDDNMEVWWRHEDVLICHYLTPHQR